VNPVGAKEVTDANRDSVLNGLGKARGFDPSSIKGEGYKCEQPDRLERVFCNIPALVGQE
jgi:hypothetical protein